MNNNFIFNWSSTSIIFNVGSTTYSRAYFGRGAGPIFFTNILCRGTETLLERCRKTTVIANQCNHYEDAGVSCQGKWNK